MPARLILHSPLCYHSYQVHKEKRGSGAYLSVENLVYLPRLSLAGGFCVSTLHQPGLASGSRIRMNDTALCGMIDYADSLGQQSRACCIRGVLSGLGLFDECLDPGLCVQIPHPALARLLNVLNNGLDIWQLGLTPSLCQNEFCS